MVILDTDLYNFQRCALLDTSESVLDSIAYKIISEAVRRKFEGKPIKLEQMREDFMSIWDLGWKKPIQDTGPYWEGPKYSRHISAKIFSLLNRYKVIQPYKDYNLPIQGHTITGKYFLLKGLTSTSPYKIVVATQFLEPTEKEPDLLSMCKLLGGSNDSTIVNNIEALIVPLIKGTIRHKEYKNRMLLYKWVGNAVKNYTAKNEFPIRGSHCNSCKTKRCMEIYERPNGNPWGR